MTEPAALAIPVRLIPLLEGFRAFGVKSPTTGYRLIAEQMLPQPVRRGRNQFFVSTELEAAIQRVIETRETAHG